MDVILTIRPSRTREDNVLTQALTLADFHIAGRHFGPTALTYSAIAYAGEGEAVYIAGAIGAPSTWNDGIMRWETPHGIGPFVVIIEEEDD